MSDVTERGGLHKNENAKSAACENKTGQTFFEKVPNIH